MTMVLNLPIYIFIADLHYKLGPVKIYRYTIDQSWCHGAAFCDGPDESKVWSIV